MKEFKTRLREELNLSLRAEVLYSDVLHSIKSFDYSHRTDLDLKEQCNTLKKRVFNGEDLNSLLPEAFALVSEASRRVLSMRPFDTQILAGIALHEGQIIQMQTGEGKTLAAVLPAYLNALAGQGVHILTFNDYLAKRDAFWMGPLYSFLGLQTGYIAEGMDSLERKKAYEASVTYSSAKEAGFDYLRDFLCLKKEKLVHRGFSFAIVDEADSVMIDEARIPLILSGKFEEKAGYARKADKVVRLLKQGTHYEMDQYSNNIYLTDEGLNEAERLLKLDDLMNRENIPCMVALNGALHAHGLLQRDKHYLVRNGRVEIIDEFTGRIASNRLFPDNIQTAVEIKEGLPGNSRGNVMGRIAVQHFLSLYKKLSGMTGTAKSAGFEFKDLYGMPVIEIPTHKSCMRKDHPDRVFNTRDQKEKAIIDEVIRVNKKAQPVLIGTGSIDESERLSEKLRANMISCSVLNARNDEQEAHIIAEAGKPFAVTVSTNMAGRGVDIRLGGADEKEKALVIKAGGLYVLGTQRHESIRIDDQLRGRAGRQGEPGESQFFICLEDELIKKYDGNGRVVSRHIPSQESGEILDRKINKEIEWLQRRVEGYHSDIRRQLLGFQNIVEQQRRILHQRRQSLLMDEEPCPEVTNDAVFYKTVLLLRINRAWVDYLDELEDLREGIHLVALGNKNPQLEFNREAISAFERMQESLIRDSLADYAEMVNSREAIEKMDHFGPSSTFTYLLEENLVAGDQFMQTIKVFSKLISFPLFSLKKLLDSFRKKASRL